MNSLCRDFVANPENRCRFYILINNEEKGRGLMDLAVEADGVSSCLAITPPENERRINRVYV